MSLRPKCKQNRVLRSFNLVYNLGMKRRLFLVAFFVFLAFFGAQSRVFALTQEEQEAEWRIELAQLEDENAKDQAVLDGMKLNTKSLQQEAAALGVKIQQTKNFIKQKNIAIAQLGLDIAQKNRHILSLEEKITEGHDTLGQLLRKTNEIDKSSLAEVVLSKRNISDFFSDVDSFQSVQGALKDLFAQVRATKTLTEKEKVALDKQKNKEADTRAAAEVQQKQVQANETEKQYLIKVNKTKEKTYEQVIADRQAKVSEIKAKLFKLAGGSAAIPFETALAYAQEASSATGVSPAFLLAILTQESNLGSNVGKCYLTDIDTGAGVNIDTGKVWPNLMKPTRDVQPFLDVTNRLGFTPLRTVVSCPIAGTRGYGGAMGPAQFIASTWKLLEDRLRSALGHNGNPWDPRDAFMASALYLDDLGAGVSTYSSEIRSACKYYGSGGSSCSYGKSVMKLKNSIQSDIDYLVQYGISRR